MSRSLGFRPNNLDRGRDLVASLCRVAAVLEGRAPAHVAGVVVTTMEWFTSMRSLVAILLASTDLRGVPRWHSTPHPRPGVPPKRLGSALKAIFRPRQRPVAVSIPYHSGGGCPS